MLATTDLPALDDDPFSHEILEDPTDFHHRLREAGPITRLPHYGVYAAGRHEQVHAALTDWQSFESSAGVGLSNFRTETPWRPPSLLLETDPCTTPRATSSNRSSPRGCCGRCAPNGCEPVRNWSSR